MLTMMGNSQTRIVLQLLSLLDRLPDVFDPPFSDANTEFHGRGVFSALASAEPARPTDRIYRAEICAEMSGQVLILD